jgi:hypothetical protein
VVFAQVGYAILADDDSDKDANGDSDEVLPTDYRIFTKEDDYEGIE